MIISVILALLAAVSNAGSNVLQRKANAQEPAERSFSLRMIWDLLHRRTWLLGIVFITASFACQAGALGTGELAMVQPLIILELPLTMVAGKLFLGSELHRYEWFTIALLTAGLGGLVGSLQPHGGRSQAGTLAWAVGIGATVALVACLVTAARKRRDEVRAGLLGAGAGITFGLTAALMKATTGQFDHGLVHVFTTWPLYAMVGGGAVGMFLVQNALQAGHLFAAQPGISLLDPFTSIGWGIVAFQEDTTHGLLLVLAGVSAMCMVVGAVLLSRSPVLQGAQQQDSESGGRNDGEPTSSTAGPQSPGPQRVPSQS